MQDVSSTQDLIWELDSQIIEKAGRAREGRVLLEIKGLRGPLSVLQPQVHPPQAACHGLLLPPGPGILGGPQVLVSVPPGGGKFPALVLPPSKPL